MVSALVIQCGMFGTWAVSRVGLTQSAHDCRTVFTEGSPNFS
jgi:hypothetical protein